MKKALLISAAVVATAFCASAQKGVFPGLTFQRISPNGEYVAGEFSGEVTIFNSVTGETNIYSPDEGMQSYTIGLGNCISNTGVVLGSTTYDGPASYWKDGQWYALDSAEKGSTLSCGITPDGKRIVGSAAPSGLLGDYKGLMLQPVIWDLQEDGTYGKRQELPFPTTDFVGRVPQYVTAICVSDDGKTIVGQVRDNVGFYHEPVVYRQAADGSWSYEVLHLELFNPDNIEFPADCGEGPDYPVAEAFMNEEEKADYEKAMEEWYNAGGDDWENYPNPEDYMSEESLAAFEEGVKAYNSWFEEFQAFMDIYNGLADSGAANFDFNNVTLSPDGKYYAVANDQSTFDPETWSTNTCINTYRFDLTDGTYKVFEGGEYNPVVNQTLADGSMLGGTLSDPRCAYYIPNEGAVQPLEEYFAATNPAYATFMNNNMRHNLEAYDFSIGEVVIKENEMCSGTPYATPDLSKVVTALMRVWDYDDEENDYWVYSYLIDSETSGIVDAAADAVAAVKIGTRRGGIITFSGAVSNLAVYDMSGRRVFAAAKPGQSVATGLASGVYVLRANAAGRVVSAKVAF